MNWKNRVKRGIAVSLLVVLSSMCLTGCKESAKTEVTIVKALSETELFQLQGKTCDLKKMKVFLINNKNKYANSFGINVFRNGEPKEMIALENYVKDLSLSELTRIYCLNAMAKERGIELGDNEIKLAKWAAKEYLDSLTEAEKTYIGINEEEMAALFEEMVICQVMYQVLVADVDKEVSDDEARVIECQLIYVTEEETAKKIQAALDEGNEFSSVAANYNEEGEINRTIRRGMLPIEVEEHAFSMENGEVSPVISVADGYYVVYCENKYEEDKTEENKAVILEERKKAAFDQQYEAYRNNVEAQINEALWDSLSTDDIMEFQSDELFNIYDSYFDDLEIIHEDAIEE